MPTVGINALHIRWGINAGTETYLSKIVYPWYLNPIEEYHFILYCNAPPPWWGGERPHFNIEILPSAKNLGKRILHEQLLLPFTSYRYLDFLFSPGYVSCLLFTKKQVVTIHDGFAWVYPGEIGVLRSLYWRIAIPFSIWRSNRVIAVSNSTARDIENYCRTDSSKISVIHEGGDHLINYTDDLTELSKYNLSRRSYYLCVGFYKDIKNPFRILDAYRIYSQKCAIGSRKDLVIAGSVVGKKGEAILAACKTTPGVVSVGRVDDDVLASLYRNSAGLIFTSLYEGFGIPILEAQNLGCPVVTSSTSSMPEVAGDGAIYVDPGDTDCIANAMLVLSENNPEDLINAGRRNAARFSWASASQKTLELIRNVSVEESC